MAQPNGLHTDHLLLPLSLSSPSLTRTQLITNTPSQRKCLTPDAFTVCKRCADQGLECEYKKHRRGRRKKVAEDASVRSRSRSGSARSRSPEDRDARDGLGRVDRERDRSHDRIHDRDRDRDRDNKSHPSTEPRARHAIQFSHVVPIEGDSSRALSRLNV